MRAAILSSLMVVMLLSSAGASYAGAAHPAERSPFALKDRDGDKIDDRVKQESGPFDVIVYFNQDPAAGAAADVEKDAGNLKLTKFKSFNGLGIENVDRQKITRLSQKAGVQFIDILSRAGAKEVTTGLDLASRAVKSRASPPYSPATAEDRGITGAGVTICVIDTGVDDAVHESLRGKFVAGFNALTDTVENPDDDNGHGTHVAAIALGTGGPSGTYRGVAPGAKLVDVKALDSTGSGTWMDIIQGIDFCIANKDAYGINIISMSVQSTLFSSGKDSASLEVDKAVDAGLAAVVCAGNHGDLGQNTISAPGAADKAITVGALDDMNTVGRADDVVASYSSRGPRASDGDSDVLDEYKPDVTAPGTNIISAQYNTASGYVEMSGCSMATPMVAGVAALMLEQDPTLSPDQIKSQLRQGAEDKGTTYNPSVDPKYDPDYGWGEAQFVPSPTGFPVVYMSDTTATVGSVTYSGRQINSEYVDLGSRLVGDKIDSITLRLQKLGAPAGSAQVGVFNSDLSVKKLFGTVDVAALSASARDYTFRLSDNELYAIQLGDRIGIKYAGGDASNAISVMNDRDFADPFDGSRSYRARYESSWIVSYGEDMYMILRQTHAEAQSQYPQVHMSDQTASSGSLVYAGRPLNAEWAKAGSSLVGKQIDSITVRLQRVSAPPGTFTVGVYDSGLQLKKAFAIASTATLPATYADLEFKLPNNELYTIQQDDRIGVFYNGGSASAGVSVMIDRDTSSSFDGTNSQRIRYESGWLYYDTGEDMYMVLKQTHA
jgi:subtilisin family serine protease